MKDIMLYLDGNGSIHSQIVRAVQLKISSGRWKPGDRIYSEHQLVEMLGLSRATVNRALQSLAESGVINRHRKRGSFVAEQTEAHAVIGLVDVQEVIESGGKNYRFKPVASKITLLQDAPLAWPELAPRTRVLHVLGVHTGNDRAEVLESRLINLDAVPDAVEADFSREVPSSWLLQQIPCTRVRHEIRAESCNATDAKLLQIDAGAALLISYRSTWYGTQPVSVIKLSYPGARHRFVGDFNPFDTETSAG